MSKVICLLLFLLLAFPAPAYTESIEPNEELSTFDPYGETEVEISKEAEAVDDLRPTLMFSLGYTYTYRTNFPHQLATNAIEQMHMWTAGVNYMPWKFLFAGVALPVAISKFVGSTTMENPDGTFEFLPEYDWTGGIADLSTYIGSELPWIPLTLTAMLMWPTGDIEKGMGTGEFSGGFTADLRLTFGKVTTKLGGFIFLLKDPEVTRTVEQPGGSSEEIQLTMHLPNSYGASISAMMSVAKLRMGVGFRWHYRTLITWDHAHVLEPSVKVVWPVTKWFATVLNGSMEVYPTFAFVPTLALVWSI